MIQAWALVRVDRELAVEFSTTKSSPTAGRQMEEPGPPRGLKEGGALFCGALAVASDPRGLAPHVLNMGAPRHRRAGLFR
jgi:hypothetical protein